MSAKPRIFISAVSQELGNARQMVANTLFLLGYEPVWQDIFGTEEGDLREMLRRKINSCQGLIQLTGQRFGFGPTNPETDNSAVSYTQFELIYARERQLKVWPILLSEAYPTNKENTESEAHKRNQKRYRDYLAPNPRDDKPPVPVYHRASNPDQLKILIHELRNELDLLNAAARGYRRLVGIALFSIICIACFLVITVIPRLGRIETALSDTIKRLPEHTQPLGGESDETRRIAFFSEQDSKFGLPQGTIAKQLPSFARKLAADGGATKYERAQGAYAARDYSEAERLAAEAEAEARAKVPIDREPIIQALGLAGRSATARREDRKALDYFTRASALTDKMQQPLQWAAIHHSLAQTLLNNGDAIQAERLLREVIRIRSNLLGNEHSDTLGSRNNFANSLYSQGKDAEAEIEYRSLLAIWERSLGAEHLHTLTCRNNLAATLDSQGKSLEAEAEHRIVIAARERQFGGEHASTLNSRHNLAIAMCAQGKVAEAEREIRSVLRIRQRILGTNHIDSVYSQHTLAQILVHNWKPDEAEAEFRAIRLILEAKYGVDHPDVITCRGSVAHALDKQGKHPEAEAEYRDLIQLQERVLGVEHRSTLGSRMNLAVTLGNQGKLEEKETEERAILAIYQRIVGPENRDTLSCRHNLANTLFLRGNFAEAETEHRTILNIRERDLGSSHPLTQTSRVSLGGVLSKQKKFTEAEELVRLVCKLNEKALGATHPDTLLSRNNLAAALSDQGKYLEAEAERRAVLPLLQRALGPKHIETLKACYHLALLLKAEMKYQDALLYAQQAAEGASRTLPANSQERKAYLDLQQELISQR